LSFLVSLGICDENGANDFMLKDGTVTTDWKTLIQEWTVQQPGSTCQPILEEQCPVSDSSHCQILLSAQFAECHKVLAPAMFYAICQQDSCHQEQVCEVIASYAHLCRTNGVCVDWRTADFCGESPNVPLKVLEVNLQNPNLLNPSGPQILYLPNEEQNPCISFYLGIQLGSNKMVDI
jgi:hypothetical protein